MSRNNYKDIKDKLRREMNGSICRVEPLLLAMGQAALELCTVQDRFNSYTDYES